VSLAWTLAIPTSRANGAGDVPLCAKVAAIIQRLNPNSAVSVPATRSSTPIQANAAFLATPQHTLTMRGPSASDAPMPHS
jgi:hypothetical protein